MSAPADTRVASKDSVLMRSAILRLRLRRETHVLRQTLPWRGAAIAAAAAPSLHRAAFGLALSFVGLRRAGRILMFAARLLVVARLARSGLTLARRATTD